MGKPEKVILLRTTGVAIDLSGGALGDRALPRRLKVLNWGDNPNCHGKRVNVGALFVKCLNADTYPYRKVALDFEHNTFPGTAAYKESKEPRPVAGFGTIEAVEGDGVYITMSSWTPEGEKMAANYADVSAGAVTDKEGNLVAVASVALCRAGAVDGMDFVEAPLSGSVSSALSGIIDNNPPAPQSGSGAANQKGQQAMDYKALLLKALGLGEDATDEAIQAALDAAKAARPGTEKDDAAISAAVKAAVAEAVKPINEKVAALSAAAEAHEKADLIAEAAREGKVIALGADAVGKITVEDLKATIAKTPVTVPLSAKTPGRLAGDGSPHQEVPEELRQIALNCGVSPEIFKK